MRLDAVVSLGSNLGDRMANLRIGLETLADEFFGLRCSDVYESAAVAAAGSPPYLNAVCILGPVPGPLAVLQAAARAEARGGRVRGRRFGARTLDVDVIAIDDLVSEWAPLLLPHPRAHLRAFVLKPWLDLEPEATLVRHGSVSRLLERLGEQSLIRIGSPPLGGR